MAKKPHFHVGTWSPVQVGRFLQHHGFAQKRIKGDDCFWKGEKPDGNMALVWYPLERRQLADGTMRDSVMRKSGYSKNHWDLWRSLLKSSQRKRKCCGTRKKQ
jgi:hypothetical protein